MMYDKVIYIKIDNQIRDNCSVYSFINLIFFDQVLKNKIPRYVYQFLPLIGYRSMNSLRVVDTMQVIIKDQFTGIIDLTFFNQITILDQLKESKELGEDIYNDNNLDKKTGIPFKKIAERIEGIEEQLTFYKNVYEDLKNNEKMYLFLNLDNHYFQLIIDKYRKSIFILDSMTPSEKRIKLVSNLLKSLKLFNLEIKNNELVYDYIDLKLNFNLETGLNFTGDLGYYHEIVNIEDVRLKLDQLLDHKLDIIEAVSEMKEESLKLLMNKGRDIDRDYEKFVLDDEKQSKKEKKEKKEEKKEKEPKQEKLSPVETNDLLPQSLKDFFNNKSEEEEVLKYDDVKINDQRKPNKNMLRTIEEIKVKLKHKTTIRIPKRISTPLFPLPNQVKEILFDDNYDNLNKLQDVFIGDVLLLNHHLKIILSKEGINRKHFNITNDINKTSSYYNREFCPKNSIISETCNMLAKEYIKYDLSTIAQSPITEIKYERLMPKLPDILYVLHRHKMLIPVEISKIEKAKGLIKSPKDYTEIILKRGDDCETFVMDDGSVVTINQFRHDKLILYTNRNFFCLIDTFVKDIYYGDMDHLDYLLSCTETIFNMDVIINMNEFKWATKSLQCIKEIALMNHNYNERIEFMRNFETLCLMRSDIKKDNYSNEICDLVSWSPIITTLTDCMNCISKMIRNNEVITLNNLIYIYLGKIDSENNVFFKLMTTLSQLTGRQLQELSSVHKFVFYSEINEDDGIKKYLKRTHTKRPVQAAHIKKITMYAKKEFTLNYIGRHRILPNILGPNDKRNKLYNYFKLNDIQKIRNMRLEWWDDIQFGKSLEVPEINDPIEYAKDKSSVKSSFKYTYNDSIPELMDILQRSEYEVGSFDVSKFKDLKDSNVILRNSLDECRTHDCPCRLVMKEREQKKEGRLFGCASTDNKHILSRYMIYIKQILSYYEGEFMTIPDKIRKQKLHQISQLLIDDNNYSIMMDIEGHNQSMQPDNTSDLLEFFGTLFGENNWKYLSHYFNHLHVFYYKHFIDEVYVSEGQLGGIEGWMNPLWTVHTLIVTRLFSEDFDQSLLGVMVYSDDVNIVTRLGSMNASEINQLYEDIKEHYLRYGLVVKPSQTVISKNRCTILRQHYYLGEKADSNIKRLLSSTMFNEETFISEQLEINGICSSASSSLEYTNHIETSLYIKWYKSIYVAIRGFSAYFGYERQDSMITTADLPEALSKILMENRTSAINEINKRIEEIPIRNYHVKIKDILPNIPLDLYYIDILKYSYGYNLKQNILDNEFDLILYYIKTSDYLKELLLFKLIMPESLGGNNCNLAINQFLSGHSNGFSKQVYYVKEMIKYKFRHKHFFYSLLANSLYSTHDDLDRQFSYLESKADNDLEYEAGLVKDVGEDYQCLLNEFPIKNAIQSVNTKITRGITTLVKKLNKNKKIQQYLDEESRRSEFFKGMVSIFRNKFIFRIANFYANYNIFYILDKLIRKVETSRSFIKRLRNLRKIQKSIFDSNLFNTIILFAKKKCHINPITDDTDMLDYLIKLRAINYPSIKFINFTEPLYDEIFKKISYQEKKDIYKNDTSLIEATADTKMHQAFLIMVQTEYVIKNNRKEYAIPKFGNEILFKSDREDDAVMFNTLTKFIVFKLATNTKWIIHDSFKYHQSLVKLNSNNIIQACDYCLNTLCDTNYYTLQSYVNLPIGGEVLHRLKTMTYDTSSNIRVLPKLSVKYNVVLNSSILTINNLVDSNINFDYVRFRFIMTHMIRDLYLSDSLLMEYYKYIPSRTIHNVQKDMVDISAPGLDYYEPNLKKDHITELDFGNIRYITQNNLNLENDVTAGIKATPIYIEAQGLEENDLFEQDVINHFIQLHNLNLCSTLRKQPLHLWESFISNCRLKYEKIGIKNPLEIISIIETIVNKHINNRIAFYNNTHLRVAFNLLSSRLRELLISEDSLQDIRFNELVRSHKVIRQLRTRSKKKEDEFSEVIMEYRKRISSNRHSMVKNCLLDLIINVTMVYNIISSEKLEKKAEIAIDTDDTYNCTVLAIKEIDFIKNVSDMTITVLELFYIRDNIEMFESVIREVINDICNACGSINVDDLVVNEVDKLLIDNTYYEEKYSVPNELEFCEYRKMDFDMAFLNNSMIVNSLFHWIKEMSETFADPIVFFSKTQSDAYAPQLALFRLLINSDIIDPGDNICDLTAGRGDGNMAMKFLKLNVDSYSRKDLFNLLKKNRSIDYSQNQDLSNPETYYFIYKYSLIHIDISFSTATIDDIADLLHNIILHNKKFTIRFNQIIAILDHPFMETLLKSYHLQLAYASHSNLKPYYIYLIGVPLENYKHPNTTSIKESMLFRRLTLQFLRLQKVSNLYLYQPAYLNDSYSSFIDKELSLNDILEDTYDLNSNFLYAGIARFLLSNHKYINVIEFDERLIHKYISFEMKLDTAMKLDDPLLDYKEAMIVNVTSTPSKLLPLYKNHINSLIERKTTVRSKTIQDLTIEEIEYFSIYHPLLIVRRAFNSLLLLFNRNKISFPFNQENIILLCTQLTGSQEQFSSESDNSFKLALKMIVYAIVKNNYDLGLTTLWILSKEDIHVRSYAYNAIKIYRRLGYFFEKHKNDIIEPHIYDKLDKDISEIGLQAFNHLKDEYRRKTRIKSRYRYEDLGESSIQIMKAYEALDPNKIELPTFEFNEENFNSLVESISNFASKHMNVLNLSGFDNEGDYEIDLQGFNMRPDFREHLTNFFHSTDFAHVAQEISNRLNENIDLIDDGYFDENEDYF